MRTSEEARTCSEKLVNTLQKTGFVTPFLQEIPQSDTHAGWGIFFFVIKISGYTLQNQGLIKMVKIYRKRELIQIPGSVRHAAEVIAKEVTHPEARAELRLASLRTGQGDGYFQRLHSRIKKKGQKCVPKGLSENMIDLYNTCVVNGFTATTISRWAPLAVTITYNYTKRSEELLPSLLPSTGDIGRSIQLASLMGIFHARFQEYEEGPVTMWDAVAGIFNDKGIMTTAELRMVLLGKQKITTYKFEKAVEELQRELRLSVAKPNPHAPPPAVKAEPVEKEEAAPAPINFVTDVRDKTIKRLEAEVIEKERANESLRLQLSGYQHVVTRALGVLNMLQDKLTEEKAV